MCPKTASHPRVAPEGMLFGIMLYAHDPTKWKRIVDKIMRKVIELERDLSENRCPLFRIAL
jgi:hypothetical protein